MKNKFILSVAALIGLGFSADYTKALNLSVKFYGAQRSGTADSNWIIKQYPNKAPCFARDGEKVNADLRGGWHDAGDNIKFTLTNAWSAYVLLKAYDAFPSAFGDQYNISYGPANGVPDILDEVKWATDYLLKANLDATTLVSQVGDGSDHDQGMTCVAMSAQTTANGGDPRWVWFGNSKTDRTGTKADILGITAASLALMSKIYRPYDANYADRCLNAAKNLYATAKTRPGNTAEPNAQDFYATSGDQDDLFCGAVELYRATNTASYLNEALSYNTAAGEHNWVVDWNDHHDYCRHSLAKAGKTAEAQNFWKKAVDDYLSKKSTATYVKGLAYFSDWGSLRYALNAAFSSALYYEAFGGENYKTFSKSQVDYVLGSNEYNRSFLVGYDASSPQAPHHKNAFGLDQWMDASSKSKYPLLGALVGGPHIKRYSDGSLVSPPGYQDLMTDYVTNEVTLDYNAGFVGATAFLMAQSSTSSSSAGSSSSSLLQSSSSQSSSSALLSSSTSSSSNTSSSSALSSSSSTSSSSALSSSSQNTSNCTEWKTNLYTYVGNTWQGPSLISIDGLSAWSCLTPAYCNSYSPANNAWNQWSAAGACSSSSSSSSSSVSSSSALSSSSGQIVPVQNTPHMELISVQRHGIKVFAEGSFVLRVFDLHGKLQQELSGEGSQSLVWKHALSAGQWMIEMQQHSKVKRQMISILD